MNIKHKLYINIRQKYQTYYRLIMYLFTMSSSLKKERKAINKMIFETDIRVMVNGMNAG